MIFSFSAGYMLHSGLTTLYLINHFSYAPLEVQLFLTSSSVCLSSNQSKKIFLIMDILECLFNISLVKFS